MTMRAGDIRRQAGGRIYLRGLDYFRNRQVNLRDVEDGFARATVVGAENYVTEASFAGPELAGTCTCPHVESVPVCKHIVATALAALHHPAHKRESGGLESWLSTLSPEGLRDIIMRRALEDGHLFRRLLSEAAHASSDPQEVADSVLALVGETLAEVSGADGESQRAVEQALAAIDLLLGRGIDEAAADAALLLAKGLAFRGDLAPSSRGHEEYHHSAEGYLAEALAMHAEACSRTGQTADEVAREVFDLCTADDERYGSRFEIYADAIGPTFAVAWAALLEERMPRRRRTFGRRSSLR